MEVPVEIVSMVRSSGDADAKFWSFGPFTSSFNLLGIKLWYGGVGIYGLQFKYELPSGQCLSPVYGIEMGTPVEVPLDKNALIQIKVSTGEKPASVNSLAFVIDNGDCIGPVGTVTKCKNDIILQGSIAGFYGVAGDHIDAFGIFEKKDLN